MVLCQSLINLQDCRFCDKLNIMSERKLSTEEQKEKYVTDYATLLNKALAVLSPQKTDSPAVKTRKESNESCKTIKNILSCEDQEFYEFARNYFEGLEKNLILAAKKYESTVLERKTAKVEFDNIFRVNIEQEGLQTNKRDFEITPGQGESFEKPQFAYIYFKQFLEILEELGYYNNESGLQNGAEDYSRGKDMRGTMKEISATFVPLLTHNTLFVDQFCEGYASIIINHKNLVEYLRLVITNNAELQNLLKYIYQLTFRNRLPTTSTCPALLG
jgi:hypothetical protein